MKKFFLFSAIAASIVVLVSFSRYEPVNKAELGKLLFSDPILSKNKKISCASCHIPQFAFADTLAVSRGVDGRKGKRNTPSAMNVLLGRSFFWDGRAKSLEEQVLAPIENPDEMNLSINEALQRLNADKKYRAYFLKIFNSEATEKNLAQAIAAFERTLETSNSPFDRWKFSNDSSGISAAVKRGFVVFNQKGNCVKCHFGADLTTHDFRNIGLFNGKNLNDSGRFVISGNAEDMGKFKTPSLRNVAITAPYMHNGMAKTLDDVIEFYNDPSKVEPNAINRDTIMKQPLNLTRQEKKDLKAFLLSLTDKRFAVKNER